MAWGENPLNYSLEIISYQVDLVTLTFDLKINRVHRQAIDVICVKYQGPGVKTL